MPGEWWTRTWNPVTGCSPVSEGCRNCWARRMAKRLAGRCGYPGGDGFAPTLHEDRLNEPLKRRKPEVYFACGMGDLFHDDVERTWLLGVWDVMRRCPQHAFMILTKRPECVYEDFRYILSDDPLRNVWLGVSVEDQATANERIPWLLRTPAAHRFVSYEPALGPVDLDQYTCGNCLRSFRRFDSMKALKVKCPHCEHCDEHAGPNIVPWLWSSPSARYVESWPRIDLVIAGGETGPGARPAHPDWFRSVRDQCAAAGVAYHFKGWGEWTTERPKHPMAHDWGVINRQGQFFRQTTAWNGRRGADSETGEEYVYRVGHKAAGRLLDGREHNAGPA